MKTIRVGFFVPNKGIEEVNCQKIDQGNPGIGGTEYSMLSLIHFLNLENKIDVITFAQSTKNLPSSWNSKKIDNLDQLTNSILAENLDILVIRYSKNGDASKPFMTALSKLKLKIVVWAHCFIPHSILSYLARENQVERIVCVGIEQLDSYRDHSAFYKSTFIYNGINVDFTKEIIGKLPPFSSLRNEVTYLGSIIQGKGFDLLAKIWKDVLKHVPDAKLNVIGSGKLYDRNMRMGIYQIAEEKYEKTFISYLLDENNQLLPSVQFHGILGVEKFDILRRTKVGVPNPTGNSETFGYTAVEMQLAGSMIVTRNSHGYLDTVHSDSGILIKKDDELSAAIVSLLKKKNYESSIAIKYITENFSFSNVTDEWHKLFLDIYKGVDPCISESLKNPNFKYKWLRELNRRVKKNRFLGSTIPSIYLLETILTYIKIYLPLVSNPRIVLNKIKKTNAERHEG